MSLKDTEEKLYNPNSNIEERDHSKSIFDEDNLLKGEKVAFDKFTEKKRWWERFSFAWFSPENIKPFVLGLIVLAVLAILAISVVVAYKLKQTAFSENNVSVLISGKSSAKSAEEVSYKIKIKNKNRVSLKDAEIIFNYPDTFYPNEEKSSGLKRESDRSGRIIIGEIKPFEEKELRIEGKFYAGENYTIYLKPVLRYKPENFNSVFEAKSQLGVRISRSPLKVKVFAPKEALDETTVEYKIQYKNEGEVDLSDLNLRAEYSDGFVFQGAEPSPVEENNQKSFWHLGDVAPGQSGEIKIRGKLEGNRYDVKNIKILVFKNDFNHRKVVYGKTEGVTKIVVPPLAISHQINGKSFLAVNLGDNLDYKISYSNVGDISLRDVVIKLKLDSPIIDYRNMLLHSGAFDNKTKTITWKASDIPQLKNLAPGAGGTIEFNVPLKKQLNINDVGDKNFTIESEASIDSSDVAFDTLIQSKNISNKVIVKLNSLTSVKTFVYHNNNSLPFKNEGPVPPEVGKETQYTIVWKVKNYFNNVSDAVVKAYLPTGVKWLNKTFPNGENISFNARTNEVVWKIGKLPAGTGDLYPERECGFQVSVVPQLNQLNKEVPLIGKTTFSVKDDFTLSNITTESVDRSTRIIDDAGAPEYSVVKQQEDNTSSTPTSP